MSPGGGLHFHYRLDDEPVPGNTKLARGADKLVLAETRGEGGQVVVAPSRHHTTGRTWARLLGGPATTPVITREQRDAFHAVLRALDVQLEPPTPAPASTSSTPRTFGDGITPGDDYENKTDWADILTPHGWQLVTQRGRTRYWLRPGKPLGSRFSATTGHADDRDRLYVFTTSTDFDAEVSYTELGALAVLQYGGDHSASAKALRADGYGQAATALALEPRDDLAGLIPHAPPRPRGTTPPRRPRRPSSSSLPASKSARPKRTSTTPPSCSATPTATPSGTAPGADGGSCGTGTGGPMTTARPSSNTPAPSYATCPPAGSGPRTARMPAPTAASPASRVPRHPAPPRRRTQRPPLVGLVAAQRPRRAPPPLARLRARPRRAHATRRRTPVPTQRRLRRTAHERRHVNVNVHPMDRVSHVRETALGSSIVSAAEPREKAQASEAGDRSSGTMSRLGSRGACAERRRATVRARWCAPQVAYVYATALNTAVVRSAASSCSSTPPTALRTATSAAHTAAARQPTSRQRVPRRRSASRTISRPARSAAAPSGVATSRSRAAWAQAAARRNARPSNPPPNSVAIHPSTAASAVPAIAIAHASTPAHRPDGTAP